VVGKMIWIIDTKIQEKECIKYKFKENEKMMDNEVRAIFGTEVSTGMIKYIGGYNHYRLRNKMINGNRLTNLYPRYINVKDWQYEILCLANEDMNNEFL